MEKIKRGLTYSDVLLIPKKTPLNSRSEAIVKTKFTKNVELNIPLASSNMATVTEHKMAIALARSGGIGVIHQFNSIEEQALEVRRVKRSTSHMIENPASIESHLTIQHGIDLMHSQNVTSLIVTLNGDLCGIFTRRDYLFEHDLSKKISDVMTPHEKLVVANKGVSLNEAKLILHNNRIEKLPVVEGGKVIGLITTQDICKLENWPKASRDSKGRLRVAAAVGVKDTIQRAKVLVESGVDVLVVDIAHAHSDLAIQKIRDLKSMFNVDVMAGNIATKEAALDLIEAGADGLKVGIGPSPVCTTRIISGSGVPQLTAILDVCEVAKQYGVPVSADGGASHPGDITKAIAAGASTVYSGSFFAGTKESPGIILLKNGKRYKRYMGSASYDSAHQRKENSNGIRLKERLDTFVEGVSKLVDYKGPVEGVINSLIRGLQSGLSYCGARNIDELQKNAEFIEITSNAWAESKPKGIDISE